MEKYSAQELTGIYIKAAVYLMHLKDFEKEHQLNAEQTPPTPLSGSNRFYIVFFSVVLGYQNLTYQGKCKKGRICYMVGLIIYRTWIVHRII